MIHDGYVKGAPLVEYVDTQANIEALSWLTQGMWAYASDISEMGYHDGVHWHWSRLDVDHLSGATYVSAQDWLNNTQSAGYMEGGLVTAHSDAITGVNGAGGGAGAGDFEVTGDQTAGYPAVATITVSGSTGNDGDYTVSAGGATHAGGTTTIPVDEAIPDGTADGDIANGRIDISAIKGFLKTTDSEIGTTQSFDLAATTNFALTDASTNYLFVNYVGGPKFDVTTTRSDIELNRQFTLSRVYRDSTALHIVQSGVQLPNFLREAHEMLVSVAGFRRASGGTISESPVVPDRYVASTAGEFYLGRNKITTSSVDTNDGGVTFTRHYHTGGVWASNAQSQICAAAYQYDDGANLANLTGNHYGVWWVFVRFDSDLHIVVGRGDYKLAEAQAATLPALPHAVSDFSALAAKIIVKRNGANFYSVQSAYDVSFPMSGAVDHNDLGNIQGGVAGERYHFASAQHTALSAMVTAGLEALTAGEVNQLENIGAVTISNAQWGYLGAADQGIATGDSPTFADVFVPDGGTFGIPGNELLTIHAAANTFAFSGIAGVTVEDGDWIGNSAATARLGFDSSAAIDYAYFSDCKVGIGVADPEFMFGIEGATAIAKIVRSNSDFANRAPALLLMRSRAAAANIVAGDWLGKLQFRGWVGAAVEYGAIVTIAKDTVGNARMSFLDADQVTEHVTVDLENGRMGYGITLPQVPAHMWGGNAGADPVWAAADLVLVEHSGSAYIQMFVPSTNQAGVLVSDLVRARGGFIYDHAGEYLELWSGGTARVFIDTSGNLGVGVSVMLGKCHIDQSSATGAIPVMLWDQADLSEEFLELTTTVGAGNPIDTAAIGGYYGKMRVKVTGVAGYKYVALYN